MMAKDPQMVILITPFLLILALEGPSSPYCLPCVFLKSHNSTVSPLLFTLVSKLIESLSPHGGFV